jgi:hypothetical protein
MSTRQFLGFLSLAVALACAPTGDDPAGAGGAEVGAGSTAAWTLLIFAATDDRNRSLVAAFDRDALEWETYLGGSEAFQILVQRDYAAFQGDASGSGSRPSERYRLLRQQRVDPVSGAPGSVVLGETDTGDPATLRDFLIEGIRRFPARHYWLIVTSHGDGWNGTAYDADPGAGGPRRDRRLSLDGLAGALQAAAPVIRDDIRTRPGLDGSPRLDVVQFDACNMATIEVAAALAGTADFMVGSRDVVPDAGHPYSGLGQLAQNHPGVAPRTVVTEVVTDYVRAYTEYFSVRDPAHYRYVGKPVTGLAVALGQLEAFLVALRDLVEAVLRERPDGFACAEVAALRQRALTEGSIAPVPHLGPGAAAPAALAPEGRRPVAGEAGLDLLALAGALARPGPGGPAIGPGVQRAAQEVLDLVGRPARVPLRPPGARGEYRRIVGFRADGPLVVEAHRVPPGTGLSNGGLSVLWDDPWPLLFADGAGVVPIEQYRGLTFERAVGWTRLFGSCLAASEACRDHRPAVTGDAGPDPCAAL